MQDRQHWQTAQWNGAAVHDKKMMRALELRQPIGALRIALVCMIVVMCSRLVTLEAVAHVGLDYGLSNEAQSLLKYTIFGAFGIGQVAIAYLADRYLGVWRCMRYGLLIALVAILGLALVSKHAPPDLVIAGESSSISKEGVLEHDIMYVDYRGENYRLDIQKNGTLDLVSTTTDKRLHIAAGQWRVEKHEGLLHEIALLFFTALLVLARCFGLPVLFSLFGGLYGAQHRARDFGFVWLSGLLNFSIFLMMLIQSYLIPRLGHQFILLLMATLILGAFFILRFDRNLARIYADPHRHSPSSKRSNAYFCLFCGFIILALYLVSTVLNANAVMNHGLNDKTVFMPDINTTGKFMLCLFIVTVVFLFLWSWIKESRADFYALLVVILFSLMQLIFWCLNNIGEINMESFAFHMVDLSFLSFMARNPISLMILNTIIISTGALLYYFLSPRLAHLMPKPHIVVKSFMAFAAIGLGFLIMAAGTYNLNADGLVPLGYFLIPIIMLALADLIITPALQSNCYRIRRLRQPTMALALFAFSTTFSELIVTQISARFQFAAIDISQNIPRAAMQAQFGSAFQSSAGIGLMMSVGILMVIAPLTIFLLRMIKAAKNGHSSATHSAHHF